MNVIEENWQEILQKVKDDCEMLDVSFNMWLKPLKVYKFEDEILYCLVSLDDIALNIINRKYAFPIRSAVAEVTGISCEIRFIQEKDIASIEGVSSYNNTVSVSPFEANLNKAYTFDTFVVGKNNEFAYAASLAAAESPGTIYNPLFLYSGVGLGKTHLMHSIAHFILRENPNMKVLYVTSETFTIEVIDAIRNGTMNEFREKYRNIDVLLIDDVQFIIGKESTQEEFFHTFNALYGDKKQIVISSDKPPKDMDILEDRIRSRFEWGLICDISSPNYETRIAILRKKMQELDGYKVSDEVIEYIAANIKSNIRELEGALTKIRAYSNLVKQDVNLELAEHVLKDIISPDEKTVITPELIINVVSEHFNITSSDIISSKRSSNIVYPRQIAMYLCRELLDMSQSQIGSVMGKRDHTTVIHGVNKITDELKTSEQTQRVISTLKKKLNA